MSGSSKSSTPAAHKILLAAEELFAKHGFAGVSVRDIARHAGVNKALVFYYYDNKAALLSTVLEQYYASHAEALTQTNSDATPREQLHELLSSYLDFIEKHQQYLQIIQHELVSGSNLDLVQNGLHSLYQQVHSLLNELCEDGALHVRQFFISFAGLVTNYFNYAPVLGSIWQDDPMSPDNLLQRREHLHWMVDRILDGLQGKES